LFDGTALQTTAMCEAHLKGLIAEDPGNAFLCVRLGNVLRTGGKDDAAVEWYKRAIGSDPHEIEALSCLGEMAEDREDFHSVLSHARAIIDAVDMGRRAGTEELTRRILAATLYRMNDWADELRRLWDAQPEAFRHSASGRTLREFMDMGGEERDKWVQSYVMDVLGEGDHDEPAVDVLDDDEESVTLPEMTWIKARKGRGKSPKLRVIEMEASLAVAVANAELDWRQLRPVLPPRADGRTAVAPRNTVILTDGARTGSWAVPSLRALFRGNRAPPPESEMAHYPVEFTDLFYCVEYQALAATDGVRIPTDDEFIEIYAAMRRRPDGKSLGPVHDAVWQASCLVLGMSRYSEAEFDAAFAQLTRSVRHFRIGQPSRNYMGHLRGSKGQGLR
jgi:hypothetical protein